MRSISFQRLTVPVQVPPMENPALPYCSSLPTILAPTVLAELSTNTTLKFYPGQHLMDSQLSVSHVNSFTMWATEKVTIFCRQPYYDYRFKFDEVQNVQVRGIILNGCRVSLLQSGPVGNAAFIKSSFVNNTGYLCCSRGGVLTMNYMSYSGAGSSVLIKQCVFSDNIGGTGSIFDSSHNLTVDQCTFKNNYGAYYEGGAIYSLHIYSQQSFQQQ